MKYLLIIAALIGSAGTVARGDVYVEVEFANRSPSASTDPFLEFGEPTALSVYIWADDPGVVVREILLTLNGESQVGVLGNGGICQLSNTGTLDPDDLFLLDIPGVQSSDTIISDMLLSNIVFPGVELPAVASSAYAFYAGFTATALSVGAGVMPDVEIVWEPGTAPQTVHTFGIYQTPTPGTLGVIGAFGLIAIKRRRIGTPL